MILGFHVPSIGTSDTHHLDKRDSSTARDFRACSHQLKSLPPFCLWKALKMRASDGWLCTCQTDRNTAPMSVLAHVQQG